MNPPARFVAVRIPRGSVGLCSFGRIDGRGTNDLENEVVCRIIIIQCRSQDLRILSVIYLILCPGICNPKFTLISFGGSRGNASKQSKSSVTKNRQRTDCSAVC